MDVTIPKGYRIEERIKQLDREKIESGIPTDIASWFIQNMQECNVQSKSLKVQVHYVCDILCRMLFTSDDNFEDNFPLVISEFYTFNKIKFPIYQIMLNEYDIEIILMNDFLSWTVSIKSGVPLEFEYNKVFDTREKICFYDLNKNFPKEKFYGSYIPYSSSFTARTKSSKKLYEFFLWLRGYLGVNEDRV